MQLLWENIDRYSSKAFASCLSFGRRALSCAHASRCGSNGSLVRRPNSGYSRLNTPETTPPSIPTTPTTGSLWSFARRFKDLDWRIALHTAHGSDATLRCRPLTKLASAKLYYKYGQTNGCAACRTKPNSLTFSMGTRIR